MEAKILAKGDVRILVIDDFSTMRRIISGLLKGIGFKLFSEAENGGEALSMLQSLPEGVVPHLIITDINMPVMNGFDFLVAVKQDPRLQDIPVLLITAEARKEDIVRAAQMGAAGYIVKPFTNTTLDEKVKNIFGKRGIVFE